MLFSTTPIDQTIPKVARDLMNVSELNQFLEMGKDATRRAVLSQKTGISPGQIETWIIQADFYQLNRLRARLNRSEVVALTEAGIDGIGGLAKIDNSKIDKIAKRWANQFEQGEWEANASSWKRKLKRVRRNAIKFIKNDKGILVDTYPHNLLVVSDLHIGEGVESGTGKLNRNEDFLYDKEFAQFLIYHQQKCFQAKGDGTVHDRPWRLIINGDAVDFLQVTSTPAATLREMINKVKEFVGIEGAATSPVLPPDEKKSDNLNDFIEQVQRFRFCLTLCKTALEDHLNRSVGADKPNGRLLLAEVDVLLAAGDQAIDKNKLTDFEELLRISGELLCMYAQNESDRTSDKYEVRKGQIKRAAKLIKSQEFSTELLSILQALHDELKDKLRDIEPEYPELDWFYEPWQPAWNDSAFERYTTALARFKEIREKINSLTEDRQTFIMSFYFLDVLEKTSTQVATWAVGSFDSDPHKLSYEELRWGLGSNKVENVWRMHQIYAGHPIFFQALAWFLVMGNSVVIQTGNHDIELVWEEVRCTFRDVLKLGFTQLSDPDWSHLFMAYQKGELPLGDDWSKEEFDIVVQEQLAFSHWIYYEPNVVYIEHGCQYETANSWAAYLDPRYVGTVGDHFVRNDEDEKYKVVPDTADHEKLFWPWGSLIVRYIFNLMEQTHPFADQMKPLTRYFTWAFSRDFLRALGLLILSLPGIGRVLAQILDRGVVEGWFGSLRSLFGLSNMVLRGASTYYKWMVRFIKPSWLFRPAERRKLRWPVLSWSAWNQIKVSNENRINALSVALPLMSKDPKKIEEKVLNVVNSPPQQLGGSKPESIFVSLEKFWSNILELAIQVGLISLLLGLTRYVVTWELRINFSLMNRLGTSRSECQILPSLLPFTSPLFQFLFEPFIIGVGLLGLLVIPIAARKSLAISRPGNNRKLAVKHLWYGLAGTFAIFSIIMVGLNVYCGLAYFRIPSPGPWSGTRALAMWLIWVIFLLIAAGLPGNKKSAWRYRRNLSLPLRKFISVGFILLLIGILIWFYFFYAHFNINQYPGSLVNYGPWVALMVWMLFSYFWWGLTPFVVLFVTVSTIGIVALGADLLYRMPFLVNVTQFGFWLPITLFFFSMLLYGVLSSQADWFNLKEWRFVRVTVIGIIILTFIVAFLSLPNLFNHFYEKTADWRWLPIWIVWGFLGLWLLESKENPFPRPHLRGWLGERFKAKQGTWLRSVFDSTVSFILELGMILLLVGVVVQALRLGGRPLTGIWEDIASGRAQIIQLLITAILLLLLGGILRGLFGWLQTEDFGVRLRKWRRRNGWQIDALLGFGLIALVLGSFGLTLGTNLLNDLATGLFTAGMLALVGIIGWYFSIKSGRKSKLSTAGARYWLLVSTILLVILWIVLIQGSVKESSPELSVLVQIFWVLITIILFLGMVYFGVRRQEKGKSLPVNEILQSTSWGFLLLAGALAVSVVVSNSMNQEFRPLINLQQTNIGYVEGNIEAALFELRLERAFRLGFAAQQNETSAEAYLERLQGEDVWMAAYFTAVNNQPNLLRHFANRLQRTSELIKDSPEDHQITDENLAVLKSVIDALKTQMVSVEVENRGGESVTVASGILQYNFLNKQIIRLQNLFPNHPEARKKLSHPTAALAEQIIEMDETRAEWQALAICATGECDFPTVRPEREDDLLQIWLARLQPLDYGCQVPGKETIAGDVPSDNEFTQNIQAALICLNDKEVQVQNSVTAVMAETDTLTQIFYNMGVWEQVNLLGWLRLQGITDLDAVVNPIDDIDLLDDTSGITIQLAHIAEHRELQMDALQSLQRTIRQHQSIGFYNHIIALIIVTMALFGVLGTLLTSWLHDISNSYYLPQTLSAKDQIWQLTALARDKQGGFFRKYGGTAIVFLSFAFGVGLILGAYVVVSGIFSGDLGSAVRNGGLITTLSWLGRRLILLVPQKAGHSGGYLEETASEIRQILRNGKLESDTDKAMHGVPYLLFGHDHIPSFSPLTEPTDNEYKEEMNKDAVNWYVNTGAWVQAYTGEVRFRREDDDHSIFVEIIPSAKTTGEGAAPSLMRWDGAAGRPERLTHLIVTERESLFKRFTKTFLRWIGIKQAYTFPQKERYTRF